MELWGDRRGQPVQIGFILLFGILVLAFAGYQGYVVPDQNAGVEFDHNRDVQSQLQDARSTLLRAAGTGTRQSASVRLGTTYPSRLIALNPSPATGTLRTSESVWVNISGATANGETGDYWDGGEKTFRTRPVEYRPSYSLYEDPPTTGIEHSVLYNEFDDGTVIARSGQPLVSGRSLSFVFVDGNYSRSGSDSVDFDAHPVSTSANRVVVEASNSPGIKVDLRTGIPESVWVGELLADQIDGATGEETSCEDVGTNADDDPERYVDDCEYDETTDPNTLTLILEDGETYTLQSAKVGVGSGATEPSATYVTDDEGDGATIPEGGEQRLVAEIRDEFDNPVSGVEACAEVTRGGGSVAEQSVTSDSGGRVPFTYEAPMDVGNTETVEVTVAYECDASGNPDTTAPTQEAVFEVTVNDVDGSGSNGGGSR